MSQPFVTDATVDLPPMLRHGQGCRCALHARRRLGGALLGSGLLAAAPAWAQSPDSAAAAAGPDPECRRAKVAGLVPADQLEAAAAQQYRQMLQQAAGSRALAPRDHPQKQRLQYIASRMIPFTASCNERARQWRWEVNLIGSPELNAFCMPGGKIVFYTGLVDGLKLTDDEIAAVMGHEIAHALREHARERIAKSQLTSIGAAVLGELVGDGRYAGAFRFGGDMLTLKFSRDDETEADAVGIELAARAGYDPSAGITLWRKMAAASRGEPMPWFSTHPSSPGRIAEIERNLPAVMPFYERARNPAVGR